MARRCCARYRRYTAGESTRKEPRSADRVRRGSVVVRGGKRMAGWPHLLAAARAQARPHGRPSC
eukprot:3584066-Prymnesium_polylepis.1